MYALKIKKEEEKERKKKKDGYKVETLNSSKKQTYSRRNFFFFFFVPSLSIFVLVCKSNYNSNNPSEKGIKRRLLRRRILIRLIVAANEIMKLICITKSKTSPFCFGRVNLFYEYESVEELKKKKKIYKMRREVEASHLINPSFSREEKLEIFLNALFNAIFVFFRKTLSFRIYTKKIRINVFQREILKEICLQRFRFSP